MCGISGYSGIEDPSQIHRMVKILHHRGPDDANVYIEPDISLGFNRLSIIDLSSFGSQPMTNEDGSLYIVFNGEIYNFLDLRERFIKRGHTFKSKTDTEVVLHGYEEYGEDIVAHLEGMFAFAIWDKKEKKCVLARDLMGIKPLYYYWDQKVFAFSSEIKALLSLDVVRQNCGVNESVVPFYLSFQYSPSQKTLFTHIHKLEPGHFLIFKDSQLLVKNFPSARVLSARLPHLRTGRSGGPLLATTRADDTLDLEIIFKRAIQDQLISDVPLGILLSGGLDSSLITAFASEHGRVKTFTAGFNQKNDEFGYADLVADHFKTDHHRFFVDPKKVSEELPKIVWHMDEPLADGGVIATYFISQYLKNHVKVLLVGEGSDELFGGYSWHQLGRLPLLPEKLLLKMYFYLTTFTSSKTAWYRNVYEEFLRLINAADTGHEMLGPPRTFFQKISAYELTKVLPNHLLMKVDKMTMAHSIEARVPFLHMPLVSHVQSLPDHQKIKGRYGKYILRKIMKDKLPPQILSRKKQGFNLPLNAWLREDLKPMILDCLMSSNAYVLNVLSKKEIEALFIETKGLKEIERVCLLWRLFLLEVWYEIFLTFQFRR